MEEIYSRIDPQRLLHVIHRGADMTKLGRIDISPASESLQVACLKLGSGQTFKAHQHLPRPRKIPKTQECWVVVRGIVQAVYYDIDKTLICKKVLGIGDCTVTFDGGHNYVCHSHGSLVYEIKGGPFVGVEADKEYIDA